MLTVLAPAKLNLTMEVLGKRPDGYHEIRSVIQTINLCDHLCFSLSSDITIFSNMPGWHADESLVSRAAALLREATGCTQGATIEVGKGIPLLSGLGGDSSDAAATLYGLNRLWELGLSKKTLLGIAARLGSDVPLFFYGGTVLASGRGEVVTPLPPLSHTWLVLIVPPMPREQGKTGRLYAALTPAHYTNGQATEKLVSWLNSSERTMPEMLESMFNVFENVAFACFDGLERHWQQFLTAGAGEVHLAGSGPALFALLEDKSEAEKIYLRLKRHGLEVYLTDTLADAGISLSSQ